MSEVFNSNAAVLDTLLSLMQIIRGAVIAKLLQFYNATISETYFLKRSLSASEASYVSKAFQKSNGWGFLKIRCVFEQSERFLPAGLASRSIAEGTEKFENEQKIYKIVIVFLYPLWSANEAMRYKYPAE